MHVSEFLDRLYASPRKWVLWPDTKVIAFDKGVFCPWMYVRKVTGPPLLLEGTTPDAIWDAADNKPGHDPKIRRALLHACGLPAEG